jgi:hypothetical protein
MLKVREQQHHSFGEPVLEFGAAGAVLASETDYLQYAVSSDTLFGGVSADVLVTASPAPTCASYSFCDSDSDEDDNSMGSLIDVDLPVSPFRGELLGHPARGRVGNFLGVDQFVAQFARKNFDVELTPPANDAALLCASRPGMDGRLPFV